MTSNPQPTPPESTLAVTAAAMIGLQAILHLLAAATMRDPRMAVPHAVAWLQDVLLLTLAAATALGLRAAAPKSVRRWAQLAGRVGLVALGMLLALYPRTLQVFLAAPANFLQTDAAAAGVFLREYLGLGALWPAGLAAALGIWAPGIAALRLSRRGCLLAGPLLLLAAVTLAGEAPNPIVFGLQDSLRQRFAPRTIPRLQPTAAQAALPLPDTVDWIAAVRHARYDHLIIVVLESVTAAEFEPQLLRPDGFFHRHRDHLRCFDHYYATNLDSYTALLAMTCSIQVPFRAYAAPQRYVAVNNAPNLVRGLGHAGFAGLFVSTYEHQPFVPHRQDWSRVLDRPDLGDLSAWVSLGSNRMEAATEDRAALPAMIAFLRSNQRTLVMAELVYGHSPQWRATMGLTSAQYAEVYLADLWDRLTAVGLAQRTLVAVVSDHGDRSRPADPDNYRVPLVILGLAVEPGPDHSFRCHLDLQSILAHEMLDVPLPPTRSGLDVVGSTERWIYGRIEADGRHVFVDDSTGRVLAGGLEPADLHRRFQNHVATFNARFIPRPGIAD
ncbi:MAG: hypothetical protein IT443_12165 [Phycisphaeraceae bacterium]|nr:hypothetical protein [Phycisphaeraceae bacterium]